MTIDSMLIASQQWYQALTLIERAASLRYNKVGSSDFNAELAQKRLNDWRSQLIYDAIPYFDQKLSMSDIQEEESLRVLGETAECVQARTGNLPQWLIELRNAFLHFAHSDPLPIPKSLSTPARAQLLNVIKPLVHQARSRFYQGIKSLSQEQSVLPFDINMVTELIYENLPAQLLTVLQRTLVLELHVARMSGSLLHANTPEERFGAFAQSLSDSQKALSILHEYPVLARQIVVFLEDWVDVELEFFYHLCADWTAIREKFPSAQDLDVLVAVDSRLSDSHRGGRSVRVATFQSGFRIVYKPRSLRIDEHFQTFLKWLNNRGDHPHFQTMTILSRTTYGWTEFIEHHPCNAEDEVYRFYQRQGGYLAIMYALSGEDLHFENLIAAGEHPVFIDVETLFKPHPRASSQKIALEFDVGAFDSNVLNTGLLPIQSWSSQDHQGVDISGLGAEGGQLIPFGIPTWERSGTDTMRLTHKHCKLQASRNKPTLRENDIAVLDYVSAIDVGFTSIYQLLMEYRSELLDHGGPLALFAEDEVRVVFRSTQIYSRLLYDSFHPDVLRNALDRDRLFDHLWSGIVTEPWKAELIATEQSDLRRGDIPIFTTRPTSRALWTGANEKIDNFFEETGMMRVRRRLKQMGKTDLERQRWIIKASLATLSRNVDKAQRPVCHVAEPQDEVKRQLTRSEGVQRDQFIAKAKAVGDRLEELAMWNEEGVSWLTLQAKGGGCWSLVPLGLQLSNGLPGVILFLAYLGAISRDRRYSALAEAALPTLRCAIDRERSCLSSIGAFDGVTGISYALTHLGALWDDEAMLAEAAELVSLLPNLIDQDDGFDIISGAAGCIGALVNLHRFAPSERTLGTAIRCGDHLLAHARPFSRGIGWIRQDGFTRPVGGFAHGGTGIAWALLELHAETGEERFGKAAFEALEGERNLLALGSKDWPNFTKFRLTCEETPTCRDGGGLAGSWCYGGAGIGLARLRFLQQSDDKTIRAEVEAILNVLMTNGVGYNHSLCHGDLSILELMSQAARVLDNPFWAEQSKRLAAHILDSIDEKGWLCGLPVAAECPGLMDGISGIGWGLLRQAELDRVPSVLMLEPPRRAGKAKF
jgi:type 2 lantibiotic biosynthesis protein LanM